jgi:hypothetical protein
MHGIKKPVHVAESRVEGASGSVSALDNCLEGESGASALVEQLLSGIEHAIH